MENIKNRRTIRKYSRQEVSDTLLNELLEVSFRAPTMGNMQLYSVVVTKEQGNKERLAPLHFNQPMVKEAPVLLTFCADFNRATSWCEQRKATPGYDNLLSFLNAMSDTLLVVQAFCTLAESKGLGTCYLGTTLYNTEAIIKELQLPRLVVPIAAITVGYPAETPEQVERLPSSGLIHSEKYHNYGSEDINRIYAEKEALAINREFVRINNQETLAQVFANVRYKKTDNEFISGKLLEVLRKQGFLK